MRFVFILLLCLIFVPPVLAQNSTASTQIKPQAKSQAKTQPKDDIETLLGQKKEIKQPQTLEDYAYQHYQQCLLTEHPILAGPDLASMCRCTLENYKKTMTMQDIKTLEAGGPDAKFQNGRMLYFVYAPCVKPTINNMLFKQCASNQKNRYLMKNQGVTCRCIADIVSDQMDRIAVDYIEGAIKKSQPVTAPLSLVVDEYTFNLQTGHYTKVCLARHEKR